MVDSQKQAFILSLTDDISEIVQLTESLGYKILKTFIQHRLTPDVNTYAGPGKIDEIEEFLKQKNDEDVLLIVNGELRPSQWFALEKKLQITVYDRIRLILAIFEHRAERREAKLQVRLAQLQYERPFVRELIHRTKDGEHPGYMAGGEYQVDDYYEMIKRQVKDIKDDLEKIRADREVHRQTRYKSGFYLVSLAGYTNAGKSSLLNLLTDEHVRVEEQLFSTLSTTTRKINKSVHHIPILLTDTVGFIENLPSLIIDAFHSTLEEIEVADVIVLVVDGSEPPANVERKLQVSLHELRDLKVSSPVLVVLNKIDLLTPESLSDLVVYLEQRGVIYKELCIGVSVKTQKNIELLLEKIYALLPHRAVVKFHIPNSAMSQAFVSHLYETTRVIAVNYADDITVIIECNEKIKTKIISRCRELGGDIIDDKPGMYQ